MEYHEDVSYEGTPVKAPPAARMRRMPPTPQQSSYSSIEALQWQTEMEDQGSGWDAQNTAVIAKMEQYLNESDSANLEVEELELLFGPGESAEVNLRHISRNASRRSGRLFAIFNSKEKSEHLVASKCDGMSVRGQRRYKKKNQEWTCKKLTLRSKLDGGL